jgi:hypothetical protein
MAGLMDKAIAKVNQIQNELDWYENIFKHSIFVWKHLILANTVAKLNFVYYIIAQNLKYSFNKVNTNIPV